jgi:hypothetical protein
MFNKSDGNWLAPVLIVAGLVFLASPWLLGFGEATAPTTSVSAVAVLMTILGLAAAAGRAEWASAGAMAVGAWSLVAPIILGMQDGAALWAHVVAGLCAFLAAIAASEVSSRRLPTSTV